MASGQDEELVGRLIQDGGEAGHRVVPEMEVVDESAEQLRQDQDVVLQGVRPGDIEPVVVASLAHTPSPLSRACWAAAVNSFRRSGNSAR